MDLQRLWFVVVAIFWMGFFVLEGSTSASGMLHSFVGRNDSGAPRRGQHDRAVLGRQRGVADRRPAPRSSPRSRRGTPRCSRPCTSPLFLCLSRSSPRGVSFEFRGTGRDAALARRLAVVADDGQRAHPAADRRGARRPAARTARSTRVSDYTGDFWDLITGTGCGSASRCVSLCLLSGATFLMLKTTGELRPRARRGRRPASRWVASVTVVVFMVWTQAEVEQQRRYPAGRCCSAPSLAVVASGWSVSADHEGWAFTAALIAIGCTVASLFVDLYPNVMVSSTNSRTTSPSPTRRRARTRSR